MPRTFSVEHARSGRSKCKKCLEKIAKEELRMGTHVESGDEYPAQNNWFHLKCFKKKIRKGPPTKNDIKGFKKLSSNEKKRVLKYVFGNGDESSSEEDESDTDSGSDSENDKPIRKGKKRKLSNDNSDSSIEPPKKKLKLDMQSVENMNVNDLKLKCKEFGLKQSGKKVEIKNRLKDYIKNKNNKNKKVKKKPTLLSKKDEKMHNKYSDELNGNTVRELKEMLAKNNVGRTGNKSDLIERIIDCKMYGTYPKCPKCYGGTLKVNYDTKYGHNGEGNWFCKGFMDDDHFRHCHFKTDEKQERNKWID